MKLKRVVLKEELVELTGDPIAAVILNQFIYWSQRTRDFDKFIEEEQRRDPELDIELTQGWIYKTAAQLEEELMGLASGATLRRRMISLVKDGWLDERHNPKYAWDRTLQYRPNIRKIQSALARIGYALEGYPMQPADCILQAAESSEQIAESSEQIAESIDQGAQAIPETTAEIINSETIPTASSADFQIVDDDVVALLSEKGISGEVLLEVAKGTTLQRARAAVIAAHTTTNVRNRAGLIVSLLRSGAPLPPDALELGLLDRTAFNWLAEHAGELRRRWESGADWPADMPNVTDRQAEIFCRLFLEGQVVT